MADRLDDILELGEPARSHGLMEFMGDPNDEYGLDDVLIKTNDGKPMVVYHGTRKVNIGAKGRRMTRKAAVDLLQAYGKRGTYYLMDVATGIRKNEYENMRPERRAYLGAYEGRPMKFITQYLTHVPDEQAEAEEEAEEAETDGDTTT